MEKLSFRMFGGKTPMSCSSRWEWMQSEHAAFQDRDREQHQIPA